jgi:phage terminase large subunit-like protein
MLIDEYIELNYKKLDEYINTNNTIKCEPIIQAVELYKELLNNELYYFNKNYFENCLRFFNLIKINGSKLYLTSYQVFALAVLSIYKLKDKRRLLTTLFIHISRKNGKSFFSLLMSLMELYLNPNSEIINVAANLTLSKHNLEDIKKIILENPFLSKTLKMLFSKIELRQKKSTSYFKILSLKNNNLNSYKAQLAICDEAALMKKEEGEKLYNLFQSGQPTLKDAYTIIISSADYQKDNFHYYKYLYAKQILNKEITNNSFFPLIFEQDSDSEIHTPENWIKSNPCLDQYLNIDNFINMYDNAKSQPDQLALFCCKSLNYWTDEYAEWIDFSIVAKTFEPLNIEDFENENCCLGLDLSNTLDMTAIAQVFYKNEKLYVFIYNFMVNNPVAFKRKTGFDVLLGQQRGEIHIFNTKIMDKNYLYDFIVNKLAIKNKIIEIGYDRAYSNDLIQKLEILYPNKVTPINQNHLTLNGPTNDLIQRIYDGTIVHQNNKTVEYCYKNVVLTCADGLKKCSKTKSKDTIDSIQALIDAIYVFNKNNAQTLKNDNLKRQMENYNNSIIVKV